MTNKETEYIYFPALQKIICSLLGHKFVTVEQPPELKDYEIDQQTCTKCGRAESTIILTGGKLSAK